MPGAKPALFPGFIEPCHPTLREQAPSGGRWFHEIKFDGYRTQAHRERDGRPSTPGELRLNTALQPIADALRTAPAKDLILDSEAVALRHRLDDRR